MMTDRLVKVESGMTFDLDGDAAVDADTWMAVLAGRGAPSCDFVLLRGGGESSGAGELWFIEAKSSSPNPGGVGGPEAFGAWCDELCRKVLHTAATYASWRMGRWPEPELPGLPPALSGAPPTCTWRMVVVLPNHPDAALAPVRDAIRKAFQTSYRHVFRLEGEPKVLNRGLAVSLGLIQPQKRAH